MAESGLGASTESCLAVGTYLVARGKSLSTAHGARAIARGVGRFIGQAAAAPPPIFKQLYHMSISCRYRICLHPINADCLASEIADHQS